jgi:CRP/FNR family transcriptional regulator, anaerobic regulatory protein
MTELEQYIKSYFGVLEIEDIKRVVDLFQLKTVKKGEYFLKSNKRCEYLGFVQAGLLRMFVASEGKEVTQWISTTGYFAADLSSFIFETPSRWYIQALVNTEIYCISKADYKRLEKTIPQWSELEKLFITRCFTMLENRIFSHLSMTAEDRYKQLFASNSELFNLVPLQYIASMLGMTPETFSRIRKKQRG